MKHLIPYFKKYKKEAIAAPFFKMAEACFDLTVPIIVSDIIDIGIARKDGQYILSRFLLMILMALLGLLCSFIAQYFAAKAATGTAAGLRRKMLATVQNFSLAEYDKIGTSTIITRMISDINQVQNGLNMFLRLFLRSPFIVFGALFLSFRINKLISLIFLGVIVALFIIVFSVMKITSPLYRKVQGRLDSVTEITRENLNGIRVIRAFSSEKYQTGKFKKANDDLKKAQIKAGNVSAYLNPFTYIVINTGIIPILWLGGIKVEQGSLKSGDIIALINYISQILVELVKLANLVVLLGKSVSGMSRIEQILDTEPSMRYTGTENGLKTNEIIKFENVSFAYPLALANSLTDISFTVKKGETIGVIGSTGSGKTTIVSLINRFYDPSSGNVFLKGVNIRDLTYKEILNTVSIADQNPRLFSGTIRSNLLIGNKNADDTSLWNALRIARAEDFVRTKDKMLDAAVSQDGKNFSGGQRQRLSIARALLKNPEILILDDASSALDYSTDKALRTEISNLGGDLTVIIVSQRIHSIINADKILVLDDGKAVGFDSHNNLINNCDVYKEIYESQSGGENI